MKRSLVFVLIAAVSIISSAAIYADTAAMPSADVTAAVNAALQAQMPTGWLLQDQRVESAPQVQSDAQKLVGLSTDQLTHDMGTPKWIASDGNGGQNYIYRVRLLNADRGMPRMAYEYVDVGSSGTVASVDVNVY